MKLSWSKINHVTPNNLHWPVKTSASNSHVSHTFLFCDDWHFCCSNWTMCVINSIWIHSLSFEPECDCQITVSCTESYESQQRGEEEEDVSGTNGICIYFMIPCKKNIVNIGRWGGWLKRVLFWDYDVWPQRKVWVGKVILYRDTQWELCWAMWDGLNWIEVHYKCQQTMSMCTLEECGPLCLSMGRTFFK